mmetsp:Transcript_14714/g.34403  ORF Transcript_14714/g.34403 Transcript_14714/m.34403 type:complete len:234 (+) Transcript_14714:936-1637(+)
MFPPKVLDTRHLAPQDAKTQRVESFRGQNGWVSFVLLDEMRCDDTRALRYREMQGSGPVLVLMVDVGASGGKLTNNTALACQRCDQERRVPVLHFGVDVSPRLNKVIHELLIANIHSDVQRRCSILLIAFIYIKPTRDVALHIPDPALARSLEKSMQRERITRFLILDPLVSSSVPEEINDCVLVGKLPIGNRQRFFSRRLAVVVECLDRGFGLYQQFDQRFTIVHNTRIVQQ